MSRFDLTNLHDLIATEPNPATIGVLLFVSYLALNIGVAYGDAGFLIAGVLGTAAVASWLSLATIIMAT